MEVIRIIDLLNKIEKNEKTPEKVSYGGIIYTKAVDYNTKEVIDYLNKCESLFQINDGFEYCFIKKYLDDEVEVIEDTPKEDKKIEKLEATLNCIKDSETILGGEYYIVHSDFVIALEETIDRLNGDSDE